MRTEMGEICFLRVITWDRIVDHTHAEYITENQGVTDINKIKRLQEWLQYVETVSRRNLVWVMQQFIKRLTELNVLITGKSHHCLHTEPYSTVSSQS